tara:strand:+ start:34 stop:342 length:309 start_codon:yes stop_codon:yes gene_type:complete
MVNEDQKTEPYVGMYSPVAVSVWCYISGDYINWIGGRMADKKRFWIGFDGFHSFGYEFDTREEANTFLAENRGKIAAHCENTVAVYDREEYGIRSRWSEKKT